MTSLDVLRRFATEQARDRALMVGAAASVAWLALVGLFSWLAPESDAQGGADWLIWLIGVLLPLGLIWLAVWSARSLLLLRAEAHMLRDRLARLQDQAAGEPLSDARPDLRADARSHPVTAVPRPSRSASARPDSRPDSRDDMRQAALQLDTPEPVQLTPAELFYALNFPDGPDDQEAIRSLRLALTDHDLARLIRAAQDVVTLLAGQGVYMDELDMAQADPALWQRFAGGTRGEAIAGVAVIRDAPALAKVGGMMRADEVFRDAAHHFLRHFDRLLAGKSREGDATLLAMLAESRSGRAFTLLAQVSGMLGQAPAGQDPGQQGGSQDLAEPVDG